MSKYSNTYTLTYVSIQLKPLAFVYFFTKVPTNLNLDEQYLYIGVCQFFRRKIHACNLFIILLISDGKNGFQTVMGDYLSLLVSVSRFMGPALVLIKLRNQITVVIDVKFTIALVVLSWIIT